jgi:D-alanyl-D-alanine carboxypeptidase (penicillin-binding protein 5/6)
MGLTILHLSNLEMNGDVVKNVEISKGISSTVEAVFESDSGVLIEKGQESNVVQDIKLEENIVAPVTEGQVLGEVSYSLNGEVIATSNIVAKNDVEKINLFSMSKKVYWDWLDFFRGY